jgi:DNA-binding transcriptional ArsR family regulator
MVESSHAVVPHQAALDQVFHALADQTRRAILRDITHHEKTVGELAQPYSMSLAAVSKHLDVLERASLIRRERRGACRMVRLNPKPLHAAQEWINFYEQFWSTNLDRLQDLLEGRLEPASPKSSPARERTNSTSHRRNTKEK